MMYRSLVMIILVMKDQIVSFSESCEF